MTDIQENFCRGEESSYHFKFDGGGDWVMFFIREEVDKEQDQQTWQLDVEEELEEAADEHAEEYARKMLLYKDQMEKWEKQQANKVDDLQCTDFRAFGF